ncbi:hypothetical protein QBA74_00900 [Streptomyces scabiei]|uniref:hypothetical protein n=1 Tax=Streptomyces scabiei TaxID=1930 RepID=UPI002FEFC14B
MSRSPSDCGAPLAQSRRLRAVRGSILVGDRTSSQISFLRIVTGLPDLHGVHSLTVLVDDERPSTE